VIPLLESLGARAGCRRRLRGAARGAWLALWLLAGCGADRDYQAAERANTVVAFDDYLRLHPDGAHAREARARLAGLVEEREWQRARSADTADAYQQYLRGYPAGRHAPDAAAAVASLRLVATPSSEAPTLAPAPGASVAKGAIARTAPPSAAPPAPPPAGPAQGPVAATERMGGERAFRVQLGAFAGGSQAAAAAWQRLATRHPELATRQPLVGVARTADGRPVHRLQLGGFSRESAEALCRTLRAAQDPCLVVPPATGGGR
jgi:hypothetical protein